MVQPKGACRPIGSCVRKLGYLCDGCFTADRIRVKKEDEEMSLKQFKRQERIRKNLR
tara:strand:- start:124 stop:294 length:171 start_codon:yes stop_codon:yes gene_type:complete